MKSRIYKFLPPGYPYRAELYYYLVGMALAVAFSLKGWGIYVEEYNELKQQSNNWKVILQGVGMTPFVTIFHSCFSGFWVLGVSMVIWIILRYASFRNESKSIYLMKRLPDPMELHRRCIVLPVLEIAGAAFIMGVLVALYYGIYLLVTPDEYLQSQRMFWSVLW